MNDYEEIILDASLPACQFYEHLGYRTHHHESWKCENGVVLVYDIMTKLTSSKKALYGGQVAMMCNRIDTMLENWKVL